MNDQTLNIAGDSDTGCVREHNEDCIGMHPDLGFAVLADGMGGHRSGEVASRIAVQSIDGELMRALTETPLASGVDDDGTEAVYLALNTVAQANTQVYQSAQTNPEHTGMGTTLVLALFAASSVTIAHVGDSRAYRLRDSHLERLTHDHSMVEEAVRKGMFTLEEARRNFGKNIITRALGIEPDVDIDVQQFKLRAGDIYLLCSDGLTDRVNDADLQTVLWEFRSNLDEAVRHLIALANTRGGHDNISVVLARYQPPPVASQTAG